MDRLPTNKDVRSPWTYVPLLYFMQALPVSIVQDVASIIYKDLGVANEPITRWTSLIALPWGLQMLFGPLVDLNSTKRKWTLYGQGLIAITLIAVPFVLQLPHAFELSLAVFLFTAIFSTLCNVATDGLYLLALDKEGQAAFAGVQSTCYRLGTMFAKGLLLAMEGWLVKNASWAPPLAWGAALVFAAAVYGVGWAVNGRMVPKPETDVEHSDLAESRRTVKQTLAIVAMGLSGYFAASAVVRLTAHALWRSLDGNPAGHLKGWMLSNQPKIVGIPVGSSGVAAEVGQLIACLIVLFAALLYGRRQILGTPAGEAMTSYFRQPKIAWILLFLMFYRFGEAMVVKMSPLFLKDARAAGGLGLSNEQIGSIKGVVGVGGIVLGGLLGGWVVSKFGLRRCFWPIAILMHLPNLLYLWAATAHPGVGAVYGIDFTEQFGYGFGFAGYMIFQMSVARNGNYPTTHYAMGVGIGALFISVAGVLSGVLQSNLGYQGFFISVIVLSIPGLITLFFIPLKDDRPTLKPA